MAAVAVVLICITIPLVMLQRRLMRTANRFVTMKGKASQARALPLGKWRWVAGGGGLLADRHHRRSAARRGAARVYLQLGRGRFAVG
jgi:hypothetical protein